MNLLTIRTVALLALVPSVVLAQAVTAPAPLQNRLQAKLDSVYRAGKFPGATLGVALADGSSFGLAVGQSDTVLKQPMRADHRMPQGSVGKTYVAAVALQLVDEGKLELDAPVSRYLGSEAWFSRLPNASTITVRQLMNHTSGLIRYEFNERFLADLKRDPFKVWKVEEQLAYLFDQAAPFAAGQGWDYSDTNYLVLGLIIERLTGRGLNDEIRRRVIQPHRLTATIPNDRPELPIAQGYAGPDNPFGNSDAMLVNGRMIFNPAFEGAGGGWSSSAADLARWGRALYGGKVLSAARLQEALQGVPARLGPEVRYGLGVIIWPSAQGPVYGHSGFFPGYVTDMRYFPQGDFALALQVNTSVPRALGQPSGQLMYQLAEIVRSSRN